MATSKTKEPERPPLAWPEQFRADAIARGMQMHPNDIDAALLVAEKYIRFVLGKNAKKDTAL